MDDGNGRESMGGSGEDRKDSTNNKHEADFNNHRQRTSESDSNYKTKQNRGNSKLHSTSQNQRGMSRSRSRSPKTSFTSRRFISSNAFFNFVHDFRRSCVGMNGAQICQLAGQRWRKMTVEEKQPYIEGAKAIRQQKTNEKTNKSNGSSEQKKSEKAQNQIKKKNGKERKRRSKGKKAVSSDSETASSRTADTSTSEDMSDSSY